MIGDLIATLSEEWAMRAIVASCMVGIMCGTIGSFIVLRNMSLIGDALSHAILPGIVVSFIIVGYSTLGFFVGSVIAGLATAIAITWIQQNVKTKNDAAVGIVFTAMFSLGVIGISHLSTSSGSGVHLDLKDFLFGNILGISNMDIVLTFVVMLYTLICVYLFYRFLFITTFQPVIAQTMGISVKYIHYFLMLLLSFAVVAALRTVGVILVVAMLITPAATALLLSHRLKWVIGISAFIGFLSAILGMLGAILLDTTPGPFMTLMATLIYVLVVIFAPERGLVAKAILKIQQHQKIAEEDIIKQIFKSKGQTTKTLLQNRLSLSTRVVSKSVNKLVNDKMIVTGNGGLLSLSFPGKKKAEELIRAHRLWETYQVNHMGIDQAMIHDEAEKLEHHLTEELLDELDLKMGYPTLDPHGSPIPKKLLKPESSLANLKLNEIAEIASQQVSDKIESELWELGLLPHAQFKILLKDRRNIKIQQNKKSISIPQNLAQYINTEKIKN